MSDEPKPPADADPPPKKWAKPGDLPPDGVKLKEPAAPKGDASPKSPKSKGGEADPNAIPSPPPWWKTLRADPPWIVRIVLGGAFIALLVLLWWSVTHGKDPSISRNLMPAPGETVSALSKVYKQDLGEAIAATLARVLKGLLYATIVGVGLGIFAGAYRGINAAVTPFVIFLRSVPMGALVPLTLAMFGTDEPRKVKFIFLAVVPFIFSDTVKAVSLVPERYVETAQTLGASNFQIIRKVLVPLALPEILTSLRFMFGLALGYIMLVEETLTEHGLGQLMFVDQRENWPDQLWATLFIIALIALGLDLLLRTIQRGLFPWRRDL